MENNELYDVGEFSMLVVSSELTMICKPSMESLHFFFLFEAVKKEIMKT